VRESAKEARKKDAEVKAVEREAEKARKQQEKEAATTKKSHDTAIKGKRTALRALAAEKTSRGGVVDGVEVVLQLHRRGRNFHPEQPRGDGKSTSHKNLNSMYCAQASNYYNTTKFRNNSYCTWLRSLISVTRFWCPTSVAARTFDARLYQAINSSTTP
jgi:hypothetical protein